MPGFLEEEPTFNKMYNKYLTANIKKMQENGLDVDLTMPGSDDVKFPDIKAQAIAFVKAVDS